jgi:hypothetical protein
MLLLFSDCNKACESVTCYNGGSCDKTTGKCKCRYQYYGATCDTLCPPGKEGDGCATLSKLKFIGVWEGRCTNGSSSSSISNLIDISDNTTSPVLLKLSNFNEEAYGVVVIVTGNEKFETNGPINATGAYTGPIEVSAVLKSDKLTINLIKNGVNYFGTYTKK